MATAVQSQDHSVLRNSETDPLDQATPLVVLATFLGTSDDLSTLIDRQQAKRQLPAFRTVHGAATTALVESQIALLDLVPEDGDRDLMILAGFASMLGERLGDVESHDADTVRLCKAIEVALTSITATIARRGPIGPEAIERIYPELAKSIRRDMMVTDMRRAGAQ